MKFCAYEIIHFYCYIYTMKDKNRVHIFWLLFEVWSAVFVTISMIYFLIEGPLPLFARIALASVGFSMVIVAAIKQWFYWRKRFEEGSVRFPKGAE